MADVLYNDTNDIGFQNTEDFIWMKEETFYWVGGSGNWNDSSHWSYESGGSGGAGVPMNTSIVIIDENSFSGAGMFINFKDL